jgi:membrane fusion protein (multidrug efflux system)
MSPHVKAFKKSLVVFVSTGVLIAACSKEAPAPQRPNVEVGIVTLQAQAVALKSELSGRTTASLMSDVRPQVSGIVKARRFEEGAQVTAGQVLYEIDPSSYRSAYNETKADVANAEATVIAARAKDTRYADLLKLDGVSQQDADDAAAAHQQAVAMVALKKAALETARINLGYTQVRAPISGRIGKSTVTPGALVTANQETALATIRALDPIYVDLTQSSAQLLRLRKLLGSEGVQSGSANVRLKLEDGSDYGTLGTLQFREVMVDEATGSVTLRAQFPNPDGVLLPGMYVRAVLDDAVNTQAILAPQQGVTRDARGNAVAMVVGKDQKVEQRTVVAERAIGDHWLITNGLQAGDQLIVEGLNKVRAGDTVRAVAVNSSGTDSDTRAAQNAQPAAVRSAGGKPAASR